MNKGSVQPPAGWKLPRGVTTAGSTFVGYLLLDAWIGNTDRHHENWALIFRLHKDAGKPLPVFLAPTYDRVSSLGRNETDARRQERLTTRDKGFTVEAYARKAMSALFASEDDTRPLTTFEAFHEAARLQPADAVVWLDCLAGIQQEEVADVFERIPKERMSPMAAEFALAMLNVNRKLLLDLKEQMP